MQYIAFDVHKHYTWVRVEAADGRLVGEGKVVHRPGALRAFLEQVERGSPVAIETVGNWYWVVQEVEEAGCVPQLVAACRARLMLGGVNKTDRWTAGGWSGCSGRGRCRWCGFPRDRCGTCGSW